MKEDILVFVHGILERQSDEEPFFDRKWLENPNISFTEIKGLYEKLSNNSSKIDILNNTVDKILQIKPSSLIGDDDII